MELVSSRRDAQSCTSAQLQLGTQRVQLVVSYARVGRPVVKRLDPDSAPESQTPSAVGQFRSHDQTLFF